MVSYDHEICVGDIAKFQKFVAICHGVKKCTDMYWNFQLTLNAWNLEFLYIYLNGLSSVSVNIVHHGVHPVKITNVLISLSSGM
jgi:hypothetical protein